MIDLYCERVAPGLGGEPLNALSNLAFFLAAWLAWRRFGDRTDTRTLALLLAAIGTGSSAFHLTAAPAAELADVVPIALFQLAWLGLFLRRACAWTLAGAGLAVAAFGAAMAATALLPPWFNGSLGYAPALLVLAALGLGARTSAGRRRLGAAGATFALSLALRSIDAAVCPFVPVGTHFLWHLLNARVLYLVIAAYAGAVATGHRPA